MYLFLTLLLKTEFNNLHYSEQTIKQVNISKVSLTGSSHCYCSDLSHVHVQTFDYEEMAFKFEHRHLKEEYLVNENALGDTLVG